MQESDSELEKALVELKTLQSMIDNIEQHLKGLRTQCAPNDEFTQKEIRVTEVIVASLLAQGPLAQRRLAAKHGVAAIIQHENPHMVNVHCVAHRLALCTSQAAAKIPYMQKHQQILTYLFYYFKGSSKREMRLKHIQDILDDPCLTIKEIHSVRGLSYFNALTTVFRTLDSVLTYLAELHSTGKDPKASGLKKKGKLVLYVSKQIIIKNKFTTEDNVHDFPNTQQWLACVGLPQTTIKALMQEDENLTIYSLLELSESDINTLLHKYKATSEDARRLNLALCNLKIATERELQGGSSTSGDSDVELHWTNPDATVAYGDFPVRRSPRPSTSSLSSSDNSTTTSAPAQTQSTPPSPVPHHHHTHNERMRSVGSYTPPPTPPLVRTPKTKYPITPPPKKKNLLFPEYPTISRSKSQESQLAHRVHDIDPVRSGKKKQVKDLNLGSNTYVNLGGSHDILNFRRHSNEQDASSRGPSGPASPIITSPIHSPHFTGALADGTLGGPHAMMKHHINHRYINKLLIGSTCDVCYKSIFRGKYCKHCKFKCHRDCANKESPSCGLSKELVDVVMKNIFVDGANPRQTPTPHLLPQGTPELLRPTRSVPAFQVPDSSSASSSNSSTHSSPLPTGLSSGTITSPSPYASPNIQRSFRFPDISESSMDVTQTEPVISSGWDRDLDVVSTNTSNDSDKTIIDSTMSEVTLLDREDSVDSQDDEGHMLGRVGSISVALKEWDIPFEELIREDYIGTGRFGKVYKGQWHGDVAIKMLNMDPNTDNAAQLSAFKVEVANLRKTRHENLVLFMGACMKPPHLAIVTSLCRGSSLFTLLHVRKEKFNMSKAIIIAQQVSQGMGYLHAKGIVHKDLKTKNIFFDKDKVVITDFGLFNVTKLCHASRHADRLQIPPGWLCYLSPEIIKALQAGAAYANNDLPFSTMSDVYAFGTVWYELLNGHWPFEDQPAESIIWQVGHGIKPSFGLIRGSKDVKDMLLLCWNYKCEDRPSFGNLLKIMERLPRKPFTRSPSHPIHLLSRSADSLLTS